jgi:hypothetical protein
MFGPPDRHAGKTTGRTWGMATREESESEDGEMAVYNGRCPDKTSRIISGHLDFTACQGYLTINLTFGLLLYAAGKKTPRVFSFYAMGLNPVIIDAEIERSPEAPLPKGGFWAFDPSPNKLYKIDTESIAGESKKPRLKSGNLHRKLSHKGVPRPRSDSFTGEGVETSLSLDRGLCVDEL